jgi:butyryl-CoA dehydrogenase
LEPAFNEEQMMIRDLARRIAEEKVRPEAARLDEEEEFPYEILEVLKQSDLFAVPVPEQYGGLGMGVTETCIVVEELARACAAVAVTYAAGFLGSIPLVMFGSEEQKARYLPRIARGDLCAFALTEADAGSDAAGIRTHATKDGDFYVLNGTKQWITNGGEAPIYTVVAVTDRSRGARGASTFIVERGTPGFTFGKKEKKMGIRASATRELVFQDCRIPKENLLGREGHGYLITLKTLDRARPGVAAQAVGICENAIDLCVEYARTRRQFGQVISSFQAVQHLLADMATQTEAAKALLYQTTRHIDSGAQEYSKEAAMCKLFASDVAMKVTTDAVQVFGGYGYMRDYPVEKLMRDAKITQIYEGTNQIQRNVIGGALVKESARKGKRGQ